MTQKRFREILEEFVVYLYPNLDIKEEIDTLTQSYAELLEDGSMNLKGDIHGTKGFNIVRERPFLVNDEKLLESFISEICLIESYSNLNSEYTEILITNALNNAIARTLSSVSSQTIIRVINALVSFSERTYEGKNISYGVIINDSIKCDNRTNNLSFAEFIDTISSTVLTDGFESFIEIDSEGYVLKYIQLNSEKNNLGLAPYDNTRILEYCGDNNIGIVLNKKGEILIFHDGELKYTKHGRRWNAYNHKETIRLIYDRSENDNLLFAKSVYLTALDTSFSSTGGIISFLDENEVQNALVHVNIRDIVNEKYFNIKRELMKEENDPEYERIKDLSFDEFLRDEENVKSCAINRIIGGRKFFMLYRKLRQELVSIDGATIIDYNGDLVAVGAIVKIEAGSTGGGRLAAAKTLSHYGISIEISSDASIKGFALDENGNPEAIFTISDYN